MEEEASNVMKKQGLIKRLSMTGQLSRFMVYISALVPAIIFIILALLNLAGVISHMVINVDATSKIYLFTWYDFIILAVVTALGVFGIYESFRIRRVRKIDDRFPDFVRDLAESRRAGMTFTKAIMYSAKGNYGVLTSEIQKIAMQISWGSSVENALNSFAKRVNTKLIRRTISLIIEASRSGGNVADVLDAASRDARELKLLESERRAGMLSYVAVIYVAMFVFLVIIIVLSKSLIPSMVQEGVQTTGDPITQEAVSQLFFTAGMIQGTLMGIVAGVFEEGTISSGIKHAFFMGLITWIILKFIVTGI
jgi:flagellar protein FlaJ